MKISNISNYYLNCIFEFEILLFCHGYSDRYLVTTIHRSKIVIKNSAKWTSPFLGLPFNTNALVERFLITFSIPW